MSTEQRATSGTNDRPRWGPAVEAVGMFGLIMAHVWWVEGQPRGAGLALLALVIASHAWRGETPESLGFRRDNLRACFAAVAPLLLGGVVLVLALGLTFGTMRPVSVERLAGFLAYYCAWGLFQQYALNGYFVNRFAAAAPGPRVRLVPAAAAGCFAVVHAPNWFLVGVTLVAGLVCARYYLRFRNLYPLGLAHGLLGSVLFLSVPDTVSQRFAIGPRALRWQQAQREQRKVADDRPACPLTVTDARPAARTGSRDRPLGIGCDAVAGTVAPRGDGHARRP